MKPTDNNLQKIKEETFNKLKQRVIDDLLDIEDPEERTFYLEDVMEHGCKSGIVNDLIYYNDSNDFYDKYEADIWELLETQADSFGQSIFEMIGSFNGAEQVNDIKTFKNLLAWYAYEEMSRNIYEFDLELEW